MCYKCRCIAYHEAGHAVVAVLLGVGIDYATIQAKEPQVEKDGAMRQVLGHVKYHDAPPPDIGAVTAIAGPLAESYNSGVWDKWGGCEGDMQNLSAALFDMAGLLTRDNLPIAQMYMHTSEWYGRLETAQTRAHSLLRNHWPAVIAVAESLLNNGELSGAHIERLVRGQEVLRVPFARWGECAKDRHQLTRRRCPRKIPDPTVEQLTMF